MTQFISKKKIVTVTAVLSEILNIILRRGIQNKTRRLVHNSLSLRPSFIFNTNHSLHIKI
jgi:hypothetical protein